MKRAWLLVMIAGCDPASFRDCAIACSADTGCPDGFGCGAEGLCRAEGETASCVDVIADAGADANRDCMCKDATTLVCGAAQRTCELGCDVTATPGRCHDIAPSNGIELGQLGLVGVTITVGGGVATFDTDTGEITGVVDRAGATGVNAGIGFATVPSIGVFTIHRLVVTPTGTIRFTGAHAAALVVETAQIDGAIDLSAGCNGDLRCAGPGGGGGGTAVVSASGCGGGKRGAVDTGRLTSGGGGGGGGSRGAAGGVGGAAVAGAGGTACLAATAEPLAGGSGGGAGGQDTGLSEAFGGGGGGALQITARDAISIAGTVIASGAGGEGGPIDTAGHSNAGAGGGAGGTILVEAPNVAITGVVAANGGGGGGGAGSTVGHDGTDGQASASAALGGSPGTGTVGGAGGNGGAGTLATVGVNASNGGGGGGGAGVIFIRTASTPSLGPVSIVSPAPGVGAVRAN